MLWTSEVPVWFLDSECILHVREHGLSHLFSLPGSCKGVFLTLVGSVRSADVSLEY